MQRAKGDVSQELPIGISRVVLSLPQGIRRFLLTRFRSTF